MRVIKTSIIGLGNIAHHYEDDFNVVMRMKYPTHLSAIKVDERFKLTAACDKNSGARKEFQKKVSADVVMHGNYKTMIEREKPDLLVIATPTQTHYKICIDAINLGIKVIFCEKPISYSLNEAKRLVKKAKDTKTILIFNYIRLFNKSYNNLIRKIRDGEWGEVQIVNIKYCKGIYNNATHMLSLLVEILGKAMAVKSLANNAPRNQVDPTLDFYVDFTNTRVYFQGINKLNYEILEADFLLKRGRLRISADKLEEFSIHNYYGKPVLAKPAKEKNKIDITNIMLEVYNNIYEHLVNSEKLLCTAQDALHVLEIASKVVESAKNNNTIYYLS